VYHSTLGLRVIKREVPDGSHGDEDEPARVPEVDVVRLFAPLQNPANAQLNRQPNDLLVTRTRR